MSRFLTKPALQVALLMILAGIGYKAWPAFGPSSEKPSSRSPLVAATSPKIDLQAPRRETSVESQDTLSLSPTFSVAQVEPGASASQLLALANNTESELTFEVAVLDVVVRDGRTVYVQAADLPNGIAATAELSQRYLNIKPREKTSLTVTFTVHPQTTSRGVLILLKGTDKATFGGTTSLTPTLGSLVAVVAPESSASSMSGAEANPLSQPIHYAFSQWESVAAVPAIETLKQNSDPTSTVQSVAGVAPESTQGGSQP